MYVMLAMTSEKLASGLLSHWISSVWDFNLVLHVAISLKLPVFFKTVWNYLWCQSIQTLKHNF